MYVLAYIFLLHFQIPLIYSLDTTDITQWDENVKNKAIDIVSSYIDGTSCPSAPIDSNFLKEKQNSDGNSHNYCEVCKRIIIGDDVYAIHLKSFRHMKVLKRNKRLEDLQNKEKVVHE